MRITGLLQQVRSFSERCSCPATLFRGQAPFKRLFREFRVGQRVRWSTRSDAGDRAGGLRAYTLRASHRALRSITRALRESLATRDARPHDTRVLPPTRRSCGQVLTSAGLREADLLRANLAGPRYWPTNLAGALPMTEAWRSPADGHLEGGRGCRAGGRRA